MKSKTIKKEYQPSFFTSQSLEDLLNPNMALFKLSKKIPWEMFEHEFKGLYSSKGRPAKPIRLMVGLLLLKQLENLSDELVVERWVQNPYYQYFCGEVEFQWSFPIDPTDLVYFRKRIGSSGCEKIFEMSVNLHGRKSQESEVLTDTTVQEKNITYPTDSKKHKKISQRCVQIAEAENINLRRSYKRTIPKLMKAQHNRSHPKRRKNANKAAKSLKTIAAKLVRELERKLTEEQLLSYKSEFDLYHKVFEQSRYSKNKIYSLHEAEVCCISKGKEHKKYEYGQKVSITKTKNSGVIVGVKVFKDAPYDGHTLPEVLNQVEQITGKRPKHCVVDRGYRGKKIIGETQIHLPGKPLKTASSYEKSKQRKRFRKRAGIEPVIGHLKNDHRMKVNFLKGFVGDEINAIMAATAFNLKKWLNASFWLRFFVSLKIGFNQKVRLVS